jgi:two-component system chemotaxis response regulator CheY
MFDFKAKVLVVDDMLTMRKIIKKALTAIGFEDVTEVKDGQEAIDALELESYELVISDWNMPNVNGIELLQMMRSKDNLKLIPFVLLTAESDGWQVSAVIEKGVDNYIVKPFTRDILKEKLEQTYQSVKKRLV